MFGKSGTKTNFDIPVDTFCGLFKSVSYPQFGTKLYQIMKDEAVDDSDKPPPLVLTFEAFRRSISFACKTTSSNCTKLLFSVFDSVGGGPSVDACGAADAIIADDKALAGSSNSGSTRTNAGPDFKGFLLFCCEVGQTLGGGAFSTENGEVQATKLHRHFEWKTKHSGGSGFWALNGWLNEFFPCVAQLLLTYVNTLCLPESVSSSSSSFSAFRSPRVAGEATIPHAGARPKAKAKPREAGPVGVVADVSAAGESETEVTMAPSADDPAAALPPILVRHGETLLLGLHSRSLQGSWRLLYSSDRHGMSFNRVAHHLLGYDGPTCVLIRCADEPQDTVLGMFAAQRWKDSNRFYGSPDNILFTLSPELKIYRASGGSGASGASGAGGGSMPNGNTSTNYQYLNMKTYGYPHGFGMGGHLERFRFFVPDTMDEGRGDDKVCVANDSDLTYERGQLIAPSANLGFLTNINDIGTKFNIECLEVWACGGDEVISAGLSAQSKDRDVRAENINKARQCDKAAFAGNAFDQEFLLGKTFEHKTRMADDATQS